jgi:hypothetical protein
VEASQLQYQYPNCFIGKDVGPGTQPKWVYGLAADPNRNGVSLWFDSTAPGYERELHYSDLVEFQLNRYYHLVVVKTSKNLRMYKDGALVYSGNLKRDFTKIPANLTIGYAEAPTRFVGSVDDVRIYNRALSDSEVKALYQYESQPQPLNPSIATATAQLVNGFVVGATIISGGSGYTNNPAVTITGGGGTGAKATATQINGVVTAILGVVILLLLQSLLHHLLFLLKRQLQPAKWSMDLS